MQVTSTPEAASWEELASATAWALGSAAAGHTSNQDTAIELGALGLVMAMLGGKRAERERLAALWALGNLCKGAPSVQQAVLDAVSPSPITCCFAANMQWRHSFPL